LFIHGGDDGKVYFPQTVDLTARPARKGSSFFPPKFTVFF
jgi:hypothetical protein